MSVYRKLTSILPIAKQYRSLFNNNVNEALSYNPDFSDVSNPIKGSISLQKVNSDGIASDEEHEEIPYDIVPEEPKPVTVFDKSFSDIIFSDDTDDELGFYEEDEPDSLFESVVTSVNDPSPYAIPQLNLFPLDSVMNIHRAARHVDIVPKQYKDIFAKRVTAAAEKFGFFESVDVKHLPIDVYGITDAPQKPTKKDIIKSHLSMNSTLYNTMMFHPTEYINAFKSRANKNLALLCDNIYPSFKIHNYVSRKCSSVGGLLEEEGCKEVIENYIENETDETQKAVEDFIHVHYNRQSNWYKTSYIDFPHIIFCYKLNDLLDTWLHGNIASCEDDHRFTNDVINNWKMLVMYHYDLMQEAEQYSNTYMKEAQALHDLYWDPLDNPYSEDDCATALISFLSLIPKDDKFKENQDGADDHMIGSMVEDHTAELISKEDLTAWLASELDPESLHNYYLLPDKNEYLILDKTSIKYAMDNIVNVEPEDRDEYATNLNRLYHEFKPKISLNIDHPYAKYLNTKKFPIPDEAVIVHLLEGVMEDKNFDAAHKKAMPQTYRVVELYDQDGIDTVNDLDPDHKKNKIKIEGLEK